MKILYTVGTPYGTGADRWIYEGYKNAFKNKGHRFFTITKTDDFEKRIININPDIFVLDFSLFEKRYKNNKEAAIELLKKVQQRKIKIFCQLAFDDRSPDRINFIKKCFSYISIFYSSYAPEINNGFEKIIGKKLHFIPFAANSKVYFPDKSNKKFACDIAFVGSTYTAKKDAYKKLLYPLFKKYKVRVYGPGWEKKDKFLRLLSGVFRQLKIQSLTKLVNEKRLLLSLDEERQLYASAKICINIHEYYKNGKVRGFSNEREFKIPASGGFQISDYIPGMERYFKLGKEIVIAKTEKDWFEKIDYYLTHDKERIAIQMASTKRVLKDHTYHNRVKEVINLYNSLNNG